MPLFPLTRKDTFLVRVRAFIWSVDLQLMALQEEGFDLCLLSRFLWLSFI